MNLDVRIPLGWLLLVLGVILLFYGLISNPAIYARHSLGSNVNLHWGAIFSVIGAVILFIARKKKS
jgi:hypothetical protein